MNEFIVLLKDGSEISIYADNENAAMREAKERCLHPVDVSLPMRTLTELMSF